jgi:hypothetical protein
MASFGRLTPTTVGSKPAGSPPRTGTNPGSFLGPATKGSDEIKRSWLDDED